ncbi:hypothetical protein ACFLTD_01665 [Elusimicrobiota bacterium]
MDKKENKSSDLSSNCPICGYYVGISAVCPRCSARVDRRISIKIVRIIALAGSVIGILLLWYATYLKVPDKVNVAQISDIMNNAFVSIEGEVKRLSINEEKNSFRLVLNDGTGEIMLNAFNKLNDFKDYFGKDMPSLKDKVKVTGVLSISQSWGASMFLSIPERLQIIKKYIVKEKTVGSIDLTEEGQIFWINVEIIDYEAFTTRKGFSMHKFMLGDETGQITMVLYNNEFTELSDEIRNAIIEPFSRFRFQVGVSSYRDVPQVKIVDTKQKEYVELLSNTASRSSKKYKNKKISEITADDEGKVYMVNADIKKVDFGSEGVFLKLNATKYDLFIRYYRWERIPAAISLKNNKGRIAGPLILGTSNSSLLLRVADFSKLRIYIEKPEKIQKVSVKSIDEPEIKTGVNGVADIKNMRIDLSEVQEKPVSAISLEDAGQIYHIKEIVKSVELGQEGVFILFDQADVEFFISYEYQQELKDFHRLNSGKNSVDAVVKVYFQNGRIRLEAVDIKNIHIK